MKKFVVLICSVSLLVLFTSANGVGSQKQSHDVAYATNSVADHPIQPPI